MKILLTGPPRIGKTTIIKKVINLFKKDGYKLCGFYTEEIKEKGKRVGFKLVTLDGREIIFSHINFKTPFKVSKYKVDIKTLEKALMSLKPALEEIVIIDEIGKMECLSERFKKFIWDLLHEKYLFLGTIAIKGDSFIEDIKKLKQIKLIEVNINNRDNLPGIIRNYYKYESFSHCNHI
ncbi:MAG TPA: AAA family ATPase [Candidatus Desulfofervidus auxilii]|uniref:AAA family ATPase n=1 Tax=Desulfofervidus auxilii TaxID=1621989 RepID=A0A7C0Y5F1_DESA2|nr:AAA family ATPase [Candidatus Desulfofervidus auxilii]